MQAVRGIEKPLGVDQWSLSPNGRMLACCGPELDAGVHVLDIKDLLDPGVSQIIQLESEAEGLCWHPDSRQLLVVTHDRQHAHPKLCFSRVHCQHGSLSQVYSMPGFSEKVRCHWSKDGTRALVKKSSDYEDGFPGEFRIVDISHQVVVLLPAPSMLPDFADYAFGQAVWLQGGTRLVIAWNDYSSQTMSCEVYSLGALTRAVTNPQQAAPASVRHAATYMVSIPVDGDGNVWSPDERDMGCWACNEDGVIVPILPQSGWHNAQMESLGLARLSLADGVCMLICTDLARFKDGQQARPVVTLIKGADDGKKVFVDWCFFVLGERVSCTAVVDLEQGKVKWRLENHTTDAHNGCCAWSPGSRWLALMQKHKCQPWLAIYDTHTDELQEGQYGGDDDEPYPGAVLQTRILAHLCGEAGSSLPAWELHWVADCSALIAVTRSERGVIVSRLNLTSL